MTPRRLALIAARIAFVLFLAIALLGMYTVHARCKDSGGTTVRGLFGLECVHPNP
jgi:hypothetical protein